MSNDLQITSLQNPQVKQVVRLRKRSSRDEEGGLLVEGYRECLRALDNGWVPNTFFYCRAFFTGKNEEGVLEKARLAGAQRVDCTEAVFRKMTYRDRPEGLLALGPRLQHTLESLQLSPEPLMVVAEAIEKPGNLGTILRSADAAGVDAVVVCDACTDVCNPNVVRASIGTLFSVPVVETGSDALRSWLKERGIQVVAATPQAETLYTEVDLRGPLAIVVGTEQVGLTSAWMDEADLQVRIPMLGQADSLNVAAATTILLYEAVRQRATADR